MVILNMYYKYMTEIKKEEIEKYFLKTSETLKSIDNYENLLFATGIDDDVFFEIDPNIGEFTVDAMRIGMLIYMYKFPNINFSYKLLSDEIEGSIFSFVNGNINKKLLEYMMTNLSLQKDVIIPFLPRLNSSHWYTMCIQPKKYQITILDPLPMIEQEEKEFMEKLGIEICKRIGVDYNIVVWNVGLQTSKMSCGENSLMMCLSLMTNGEYGYQKLLEFFESDYKLESILDVYYISTLKKCVCENCVDKNDIQNRIINEPYKICIKCNNKYKGSIGFNECDSENCKYCKEELTNQTYVIYTHRKTYNKKQTEILLRMEILKSIESGLINEKHDCELTKIKKTLNNTKNELEELKLKYEKLLNEVKQNYQNILKEYDQH